MTAGRREKRTRQRASARRRANRPCRGALRPPNRLNEADGTGPETRHEKAVHGGLGGATSQGGEDARRPHRLAGAGAQLADEILSDAVISQAVGGAGTVGSCMRDILGDIVHDAAQVGRHDRTGQQHAGLESARPKAVQRQQLLEKRQARREDDDLIQNGEARSGSAEAHPDGVAPNAPSRDTIEDGLKATERLQPLDGRTIIRIVDELPTDILDPSTVSIAEIAPDEPDVVVLEMGAKRTTSIVGPLDGQILPAAALIERAEKLQVKRRTSVNSSIPGVMLKTVSGISVTTEC